MWGWQVENGQREAGQWETGQWEAGQQEAGLFEAGQWEADQWRRWLAGTQTWLVGPLDRLTGRDKWNTD